VDSRALCVVCVVCWFELVCSCFFVSCAFSLSFANCFCGSSVCRVTHVGASGRVFVSRRRSRPGSQTRAWPSFPSRLILIAWPAWGRPPAATMVASAIYIMDLKGKIIISRDYRGDIPLSATVKFSQRLQESEESEIQPVFSIDGITYIFVREANLLLLALAKKNSNITVILLFLSHILRVMTDYFGEVTEETIRDNFVITYELLDEMMDYGCVRASSRAAREKRSGTRALPAARLWSPAACLRFACLSHAPFSFSFCCCAIGNVGPAADLAHPPSTNNPKTKRTTTMPPPITTIHINQLPAEH
jgi:hypothetical protein